MTLFELPPPGELGGGWSLKFLTAAQMLECRGEGEAQAGEERDKALRANAALLARVLLKEGEPAFPDGEAVLASLTVGQMDSLTRRWWEQDDFSGRPLGEEQAARTEWTDREGSENERFDMARFLALGGEVGSPPQDFRGEGLTAGGLPEFPAVWPRIILPARAAETAQRTHREPYLVEGMAVPYSGEAPSAEGTVFPSRQRSEGVEPTRGEHSTVKVLLPEPAQESPGLTVEELDAAVERDARRYDGGFTLL